MLFVFTIVAAGLAVCALIVLFLVNRAPIVLPCDQDCLPKLSDEFSKQTSEPAEKPAARSA